LFQLLVEDEYGGNHIENILIRVVCKWRVRLLKTSLSIYTSYLIENVTNKSVFNFGKFRIYLILALDIYMIQNIS
jgi:hypothetical protein